MKMLFPIAAFALMGVACAPETAPATPAAASSALLVVRTDLFASRDWCQREVLAAKRSGVLGESQDGMLVIKDSASLKPIQRKKMESLVNSENADRNLLYSEVVQSNSLATTRTMDVQKSFSRSFQSESPSGTWVESESGTWSKKP